MVIAIRNPQRLYARRACRPKIQSELHGDMQSWAEMIRPRDQSVASNKTVGPYPPWAQET